MIIAIDGPSGAGKSTLGKMLAKRLNLLYLDTGAMYRGVGLAVLESGTSIEDEEEIIEIAENAEIELIGEPDSLQVLLNGRDVSTEIRTNEVGQIASIVSTIPEVRKVLVEHQRNLGENAPEGCVLDGRDIGTVIFPNADAKFFLTAKPEARARRRFEEDLDKGRATTYEQTLAEINLRDERDISRADSPLMIAEDAVVIDTSELNLREVFEQMMRVLRERQSDERTRMARLH
ncbi:MAG: (d)CMP kinase [Acidobacteria bacterium]|jgi:cytidylate kinase|nr:(d)CMP kinase [Acidobacteriota bacterium]